MIDFRQEIKQLIEAKNTDIAKVARKADLTYTTLHNFLKGKSEMKSDNLQKVFDILTKMNTG